MTAFRHLGEGLAHGPAPAGWTAVRERRLVVVVGLTGVGKTTALAGLDPALPRRELPNRRWLTDEIMIPDAAAAAGLAEADVTDRAARFRLTARYREAHPGGMAEVLAGLAVPEAPDLPLLFDGLRGANEAGFAARHLPRARFLALTAPDEIRLRRLLTRNDAFDGQGRAGAFIRAGAQALLAETTAIPPGARPRLLDWLGDNAVPNAELQAKLEIVAEERRNYDPAATLAELRDAAAGRLAVIDTAREPPAAAAAALGRLLLEPWGSPPPTESV